jgi:hypothetical protein
MPDNWGYVLAAYGVAAIAIGWYRHMLGRRARGAREAPRPGPRASGPRTPGAPTPEAR